MNLERLPAIGKLPMFSRGYGDVVALKFALVT
jgi:hypothetical protein